MKPYGKSVFNLNVFNQLTIWKYKVKKHLFFNLLELFYNIWKRVFVKYCQQNLWINTSLSYRQRDHRKVGEEFSKTNHIDSQALITIATLSEEPGLASKVEVVALS